MTNILKRGESKNECPLFKLVLAQNFQVETRYSDDQLSRALADLGIGVSVKYHPSTLKRAFIG